jgi:hypothetical protein
MTLLSRSVLIQAIAYLITKGQIVRTLGTILWKEFETLLDEIYYLWTYLILFELCPSFLSYSS